MLKKHPFRGLKTIFNPRKGRTKYLYTLKYYTAKMGTWEGELITKSLN